MYGFLEQNKGNVMEYNGAAFATVQSRVFFFFSNKLWAFSKK